MSKTRGHDNRQMQWRGTGIWHHIQTERPNRRKAKMLELDVVRSNAVDADGTIWPLARKPHQYFY